MKKEFIISLETEELSFRKEKWNMLIGPIGSGKSVFLKKLSSKSNMTKFFPQEKVLFLTDQENYPQEKIIERLLMDLDHQSMISEVLNIFEIKDLSVFFNYKKSIGLYQILTFLYRYLEDPTVLILDQSFSLVDSFHKNQFLKWLKKDTKKKKITVIYTTMVAEELMLADTITLWYQNRKIVTGSRKQIFKEDALFQKIGLEMPFVMELYHKLKYYEIIDHPVYEIEKMVDELWK